MWNSQDYTLPSINCVKFTRFVLSWDPLLVQEKTPWSVQIAQNLHRLRVLVADDVEFAQFTSNFFFVKFLQKTN